MFKEYLKMAIKNIRTRPLRSWLTILGIVIGIFLVISLLSLSRGLEETILNQLSMFGKDIIMIMPGEMSDFMTTMMGGLKITEDDLEIIRKTEGVKTVLPFIFQGQIIRYEGDGKAVILSGVDWRQHSNVLKQDLGWSLAEGEWPVAGKREALLGSFVADEIFPNIKIGDNVSIKGQRFEVVGILKSLGQKSDDSLIHIDLEIYRSLTGDREGALQAVAKTELGYSPEAVAEAIKENLSESVKRKRGEEELPFSVLTSEKVGDIVGNIMGVIQIAVFAFASIAIIVGGIGITNTMYTSVHERTKEIGILKAVGAKSQTITMIFLVESGLIGLIGGLGGLIPGFGLAKAVEMYARTSPSFVFRASVSPGLILFGLGFSFLIGCLSGFFPAKRAAKLNPVDALRYE